MTIRRICVSSVLALSFAASGCSNASSTPWGGTGGQGGAGAVCVPACVAGQTCVNGACIADAAVGTGGALGGVTGGTGTGLPGTGGAGTGLPAIGGTGATTPVVPGAGGTAAGGTAAGGTAAGGTAAGGTAAGGDTGLGGEPSTAATGGTPAADVECESGIATGDACDPAVDTTCSRTQSENPRTCVCGQDGSWTCTAVETGSGGDGSTGGTAGTETGGSAGTETGGTAGTGGATDPAPASGEDDFAECGRPTLPGMNELPSISKLPDPFTYKFGDGGTVTTKADWTCRRSEINACAQEYIYGAKPIPDSVSATFSGGNLKITVQDEGKSIDFTISISGGDPSNPKPLLLKYGGGMMGGNLPGMPSEVIQTSFPDGEIAADGKQRSGKFYDLYGSSHPAGELIAWAWGVSRVIDALEKTPEAGIDPTKVAVHGCSRWGKGALAAGAFDKRVALTLPEEAGSGGGAAWRMIATDSAAQPLSSACTECVWFHKDFCNFDGKQDKLPIDMDEVMGMVAPRGLLYLDQTSADWLGKSTTYWSSHATREIYRALGEEGAFTYSQMNGSGHCQTPQGQSQFITAYANYYLLGTGSKPSGAVNKSGASEFNASQWIDWDTPTLQ